MQWLYSVLKLARKLCINLEFKTTQLYAIKLHTCAGISCMELIMQVLADKTAIFLEQFWYVYLRADFNAEYFFFSFDNVCVYIYISCLVQHVWMMTKSIEQLVQLTLILWSHWPQLLVMYWVQVRSTDQHIERIVHWSVAILWSE